MKADKIINNAALIEIMTKDLPERTDEDITKEFNTLSEELDKDVEESLKVHITERITDRERANMFSVVLDDMDNAEIAELVATL